MQTFTLTVGGTSLGEIDRRINEIGLVQSPYSYAMRYNLEGFTPTSEATEITLGVLTVGELVGRTEGNPVSVREILELIDSKYQRCPDDTALYQRMQPWEGGDRWWVFLSNGTRIRGKTGHAYRCFLACVDGWLDPHDGTTEPHLQADYANDDELWPLILELVVRIA